MQRLNSQDRLTGAEVLPPMIPKQTRLSKPAAAGRQSPLTAVDRKGSHSMKCKQRFQMLNQFVDDLMVNLNPRQIKVWICLYRDARNGVAKSAQSYIATLWAQATDCQHDNWRA